MPLTTKGEEIKAALTEEYGEKKNEEVIYAGAQMEDAEFRAGCFAVEMSSGATDQLVSLARKRGYNDDQIKGLLTIQPRWERVKWTVHDTTFLFQNWSLGFLAALAAGLDGRVRVIIEPAEDVLDEYVDREA